MLGPPRASEGPKAVPTAGIAALLATPRKRGARGPFAHEVHSSMPPWDRWMPDQVEHDDLGRLSSPDFYPVHEPRYGEGDRGSSRRG